MEEETQAIKKRIVWRWVIIILVILVLILFIWNPFFGNDKESTEGINGENATLEEMCSSIKGTPAWADSKGVVLYYGYNETYLVEDLIEDKIYFLYNPGCGWCHKQIEYFGESWQEYVDSNYTVDCMEVMASN